MDLEGELDELYGLPLEQFTRGRNALASRLREEGERQSAERVRALRKPTVAAWVLNQLARAERKGIERLLAATDALAAAPGDEAQAALDEQRGALRELGRAARKLAPAAAGRAVETLRAAAIDLEARPLLERGRLTRELEAAGFGGVPPESASATSSEGRSDELAVRRHRREEEQRRVRELRARARELERAALQAERAADQAEEEAERLRAEAEEAREAAEAAASELEQVERAVRPVSSGRTRRS